MNISFESNQDFVQAAFNKVAEVIYEHGLFSTALTRGDGEAGEDVTHNMRTVKNLPLRLRPLPGRASGQDG